MDNLTIRWLRRPTEGDVADVLMALAALAVAGLWAVVLAR